MLLTLLPEVFAIPAPFIPNLLAGFFVQKCNLVGGFSHHSVSLTHPFPSPLLTFLFLCCTIGCALHFLPKSHATEKLLLKAPACLRRDRLGVCKETYVLADCSSGSQERFGKVQGELRDDDNSNKSGKHLLYSTRTYQIRCYYNAPFTDGTSKAQRG